jgi:hypothetical protein
MARCICGSNYDALNDNDVNRHSYCNQREYVPRYPKEKNVTVSIRIPDARTARRCIEGIASHLEREEGPLSAADLRYSVQLLVGEHKPLGISSIARMAGNIASGLVSKPWLDNEWIAKRSVEIARAIAKELEQ